MVGTQDRWQEDLFVAGPLRELIPEDHILKQVDRILDLSWLRDEVKDAYHETMGRPSIDPEAAVRLMLAGFFQGIVQDRKLMREARVNLAIRWFAGYRLDEALPDHSTLTRIRQRWGVERFKRIFEHSVQSCIQAGLVNAETVHVDATLIRADVSWASLVEVHAQQVLEANSAGEPPPEDPAPGKPPKAKKRSTTDPDASLATSRNDQRLEPSYKEHVAVEDRSGVIVDVAVTTGEASEGAQLLEQIDRIEQATGTAVKALTADTGYASARNYAGLEAHTIDAIIPPQQTHGRPARIPSSRFKYDARHDVLRCPRGKALTRHVPGLNGYWYRSQARDCARCPLRTHCLPATAKRRSILIVDGYPALLRARRRHARRSAHDHELYTRHHWQIEGVHGRAKTQHGLRRAVRRGLDNVSIQAYLTAAAMNLKRLASRFLRKNVLGTLQTRTGWPFLLQARLLIPKAQGEIFVHDAA